MKTLCFGSLNIDHVYRVRRIVREGETIGTLGYARHLGGKGLNQSVALARAGLSVCHAGLIGADGAMLRDWLNENGVDTRFVREADERTGHALIQVDEAGRNCILLYGGANQCVARDWIDEVLGHFGAGDLILLQNEISGLPDLLSAARRRGMRIALNPSPISDALPEAPLSFVDVFILNEIEGEELTRQKDPDAILSVMLSRYPNSEIVLTLGEKGAMYARGAVRCAVPAERAHAVDTTAAGDTFTGFFLAGQARGMGPQEALAWAAKAAAVTVSRSGASQSIPFADEL